MQRASKFAESVGLERICRGLGSLACVYSHCWLMSNFLVKLKLEWIYTKSDEFQNSFSQAPLFLRPTRFVWFCIWFFVERSSTIWGWFNFCFPKPEFTNFNPQILPINQIWLEFWINEFQLPQISSTNSAQNQPFKIPGECCVSLRSVWDFYSMF